jgi:hypothetical protein
VYEHRLTDDDLDDGIDIGGAGVGGAFEGVRLVGQVEEIGEGIGGNRDREEEVHRIGLFNGSVKITVGEIEAVVEGVRAYGGSER